MSSRNPVKDVNMSWVSWEEDEELWKLSGGRVFFCVGREVVEWIKLCVVDFIENTISAKGDKWEDSGYMQKILRLSGA